MFAREIRRQRVNAMRGFRHGRWHLDEMYVKLNGETVYLWRAVDHEGELLGSFVTRNRDKAAALRFMKKTLKRHGSPERITTDGLRSYGAAMDDLGDRDKQDIGRWANNRGENSHLAFRRRERAMLGFRRMKVLQKFASVHTNVHNQFFPGATSHR
jgi:putative transposase